MKILMVNKFLYPRGGSESYMLYLGEHFKKLGHEVQYFGMYDKQNTVGNDCGAYTQNMDFHGTGLARFLYPFKILYSREAKRKIMQVIDDFKPDIVHSHTQGMLADYANKYAKKNNIPSVTTAHTKFSYSLSGFPAAL